MTAELLAVGSLILGLFIGYKYSHLITQQMQDFSSDIENLHDRINTEVSEVHVRIDDETATLHAKLDMVETKVDTTKGIVTDTIKQVENTVNNTSLL